MDSDPHPQLSQALTNTGRQDRKVAADGLMALRLHEAPSPLGSKLRISDDDKISCAAIVA